MAFEQTTGGIDFGFLPPNYNGDVQTFMTDNQAQGAYQKWIKPRGVTMCYMEVISGGGGGGGGRTGATTTARGGGGGGAAGNIAKLLIPAIFVPDVLLIRVGAGGVGGAANTDATIGGISYISYGAGITAQTTIPNIILLSASSNQGAATAGTAAGAGAAGTAGGVTAVSTIGAAASHGIFLGIVGPPGVAGGIQTGQAGNAVGAVWNTIGLSGGSGGAGVNNVNQGFAGGAITIQSSLDFADGTITPAAILAGGIAGPGPGTGPGGNGNPGIQLWKPFYMTGGTGGGSSDNAIGGNGGSGGIGCGGGGGGAGTTGGTGGNGGNGFVIIISM